MRAGRAFLVAAATLLLLLLPGALAAASEPLVVAPEQAWSGPLRVSPGSALRLNWSVTNTNEVGFVVLLAASGPAGWNVTVSPASFDVPARGAGAVRSFAVVAHVPEHAPADPGSLVVHLAAANSTTGDTLAQDVDVPLQVAYQGLVLGALPNPLPRPLDNAYGVFLLDLAFWAVVAGALLAVHGPLVGWLTRHAERHVGAKIVAMLRTPIFLTIVFFGLTQAWDALPPSWWVDGGHRVLAAVFILVAMYVVYKAFRAMLIYYIENIAAKTASDLDDILMPVLEKVGGVVIVVAGALYFVGTLGIDLSGFVAGGVVVSMVLAFAAQDTLSNFFAGIFLLLDRPFVRGDDIIVSSSGLGSEFYRVDDIGLRSTRLYHYNAHQLVIVPNNELAKNPIINLMHPDQQYRCIIEVGVGYDSDVGQVRDILMRAAKEHPMSAPTPEPRVRFEQFGDSALTFRLLFFIREVRKRQDTMSDVRQRILEDFRRAGIEIPFPQRVITVKGEGAPGNGAPVRAALPDRPKGP